MHPGLGSSLAGSLRGLEAQARLAPLTGKPGGGVGGRGEKHKM